MTENTLNTHLTNNELSLAKTLYAARKHKGLTQKEVSQQTGITQGTLSKIETATTSLSAKNWFSLSQLLEVPHNAYYIGSLDLTERPNYKSFDSQIKIPKKFIKDQCISVRGLLPIIEHLKNKFSEEKWEQCLDKLKIDPLCFSILHLTFSSELIKSIIGFFYADEMLFSRDIEKVAAIFSKESSHGLLASSYNKKSNPILRLQQYIERESYYQKIVESSLYKESDYSAKVRIKQIERGPFKNPQIFLNLYTSCLKAFFHDLEFTSITQVDGSVDWEISVSYNKMSHDSIGQ